MNQTLKVEYTDEEILDSLRVLFSELFDCKGEIQSWMTVEDYLVYERAWNELDISDLFHGIEHYFGCKFSKEELNDVWGLGSKKTKVWLYRDDEPPTFQSFIDELKKKVKPVSLAPVTIAGSRCAAAGIFRGLENLLDQIDPKDERIAPSTPLFRRVNLKTLEVLENRLRWVSGGLKPVFLRSWVDRIWGNLFPLLFLLCWGGGFVAWVFQNNLYFILSLAGGILSVIVFFLVYHTKNPLPKDVVTFGDLARYLAAKKMLDGST